MTDPGLPEGLELDVRQDALTTNPQKTYRAGDTLPAGIAVQGTRERPEIRIDTDKIEIHIARLSGPGTGTIHLAGNGAGTAIRDGIGPGDAIRSGQGDGDAIRCGRGEHGDAVRTGAGLGNALREGAGHGDALCRGMGGDAVRIGARSRNREARGTWQSHPAPPRHDVGRQDRHRGNHLDERLRAHPRAAHHRSRRHRTRRATRRRVPPRRAARTGRRLRQPPRRRRQGRHARARPARLRDGPSRPQQRGWKPSREQTESPTATRSHGRGLMRDTTDAAPATPAATPNTAAHEPGTPSTGIARRPRPNGTARSTRPCTSITAGTNTAATRPDTPPPTRHTTNTCRKTTRNAAGASSGKRRRRCRKPSNATAGSDRWRARADATRVRPKHRRDRTPTSPRLPRACPR